MQARTTVPVWSLFTNSLKTYATLSWNSAGHGERYDQALVLLTYPVSVPLLAFVDTLISTQTRRPLLQSDVNQVGEALATMSNNEFDAFIENWVTKPQKSFIPSKLSQNLLDNLEECTKKAKEEMKNIMQEKRNEIAESNKNKLFEENPQLKNKIGSLEVIFSAEDEKEIKEYRLTKFETLRTKRRIEQTALITTYMTNELHNGTLMQQTIVKGLGIQEGKQIAEVRITDEIDAAIKAEMSRLNNSKGFFSNSAKAKALRIQTAYNNVKNAIAAGTKFTSYDDLFKYNKNDQDGSLKEALNASRVSLADQPMYGNNDAWTKVSKLF